MYYKNYLSTYLFFFPFSGRWSWPGKFKNDVNLAFGLVLSDFPAHGYFNCNMVHDKHRSFTTLRTLSYSKLMLHELQHLVKNPSSADLYFLKEVRAFQELMHEPSCAGNTMLRIPLYCLDLWVRESHIPSLTGGFSPNAYVGFFLCVFVYFLFAVYIPLASDDDVLMQIATDH